MATYEVCFKVGDSNPANHSQETNWEDGQIIQVKPPGVWMTAAEMNTWANGGAEPAGFSSIPAAQQSEYERFRLRYRRYTRPGFSRLWHINTRYASEIAATGLGTVTQTHLDDALALQASVAAGRNIGRPFIMVAPEYPNGGGPIPNAPLVPDPTQPDPTYAPLSANDKLLLRLARMHDVCADQEVGIQGQIDRITLHGGEDSNWGFADLMTHSVVTVDATPAQLNKATREWDDDTQDVMAPRRRVALRYWRIDYTAFMTAPQIAAVQDPTVFVPVDRVSAPVPVATAVTRVARNLAINPEGPGPGTDP